MLVNPNNEDLTEVVKSATDGRGVDIAIVTAPNLQAYRAGIDVCRKGGKLCVFAPTDPAAHLRLSPKELFFSETQIIPSYSTSHLETRTALHLIESGRVKAKELITHCFKLEDAAKALRVALESKESLKVVILNSIRRRSASHET
jgi:L-iditol 2-dehydrogenase